MNEQEPKPVTFDEFMAGSIDGKADPVSKHFMVSQRLQNWRALKLLRWQKENPQKFKAPMPPSSRNAPASRAKRRSGGGHLRRVRTQIKQLRAMEADTKG